VLIGALLRVRELIRMQAEGLCLPDMLKPIHHIVEGWISWKAAYRGRRDIAEAGWESTAAGAVTYRIHITPK
jgi:hypothetical protein